MLSKHSNAHRKHDLVALEAQRALHHAAPRVHVPDLEPAVRGERNEPAPEVRVAHAAARRQVRLDHRARVEVDDVDLIL